MNPRSHIFREVQSRLNAGESKANIYHALKTKFHPTSVERSLAQWPLPAAKKANRQMSIPLIIVSIFFALLTILSVAPILDKLAPVQIANVAIILIIQAYTIYGIFNCNLIGYMLLVLMSLRNILMILSGIVVQGGISDPKMGMLLAMSAAAILLATLQKRRLFPNTSWFLRHKRDAEGNPIF